MPAIRAVYMAVTVMHRAAVIRVGFADLDNMLHRNDCREGGVNDYPVGNQHDHCGGWQCDRTPVHVCDLLGMSVCAFHVSPLGYGKIQI